MTEKLREIFGDDKFQAFIRRKLDFNFVSIDGVEGSEYGYNLMDALPENPTNFPADLRPRLRKLYGAFTRVRREIEYRLTVLESNMAFMKARLFRQQYDSDDVYIRHEAPPITLLENLGAKVERIRGKDGRFKPGKIEKEADYPIDFARTEKPQNAELGKSRVNCHPAILRLQEQLDEATYVHNLMEDFCWMLWEYIKDCQSAWDQYYKEEVRGDLPPNRQRTDDRDGPNFNRQLSKERNWGSGPDK